VRAARAALLIIAALPAQASVADAQVSIGREAPRKGSIEAAGGAVWMGGFDIGDRTAQLTRNLDSNPFDLFTTSSRLDPVTGLQGRLAFYFSPSIAIEGGVRYARPVLAIESSADVEEAEATTSEERISHYVVDGSLVFHLTGAAFAGGRAVPFVAGGAGYLRELHEGNELVETGTEYHASAGLKYWFGAGSRRFGLRGEAGVSVRDGGVDFGAARRAVPVFGASLLYLF
jgi:hypothetical protein